MLSVTLSIWSARFTPDEITSRLGVEPDGVAVRGVDRTPARLVPKANGWHLTEDSDEPVAVEEIVGSILGRAPARADLASLRNADPELEIRLVVYLDRSREDTSVGLSPNMLAQLAELHANLFIDRVDLFAKH